MAIEPKQVVEALSMVTQQHLDIRTKALLEETIKALNDYRKLYIEYNADDFEIKGCPSKKDIWWQMIQLLPSSYNQTRNVMMNYEVLANIYKSRKDHKLDEWRSFCKWVEELPYSELIIETAVSLEVGRMFGEPFPWTKEADKRMGANSCSMKDVEEAIKRFDPNDGVKSHMTMIKED